MSFVLSNSFILSERIKSNERRNTLAKINCGKDFTFKRSQDGHSYKPRHSKLSTFRDGSASSKNINIMMAAESEPYRIMQNAMTELENY